MIIKSKWTKYLKQGIISIGVVLLFAFVYPYFCSIDKEQVYEHNGITIYADANNDNIKRVFDEAMTILTTYGIDSEIEAKVVFCSSRTEYSIKNFFISTRSLASNRAELGLILFSPVDWDKGVVPAINSNLNSRSLASIIAHELVHTNQLKRLGFINYKIAQFTNKWKLEGEAEHVSASSSLPEDKGLELFLGKGYEDAFIIDNDLKAEYFYFLSHLRANYLFDTKHVSKDDYWSTHFDLDELDGEIRSYILNSKKQQ